MKLRWKFLQDDSADGVEVIVKAKEKNEDVERVLALLGGEEDAFVCQPLVNDEKVAQKDIVIVSKNGRLLSVKTLNGEYAVKEPLYKMEERLDPTRFVKISQSEIVNLEYVRKWNFGGGGVIMVEMIDGTKTYTSRRYTSSIRKKLKKGR